MSAEYGSSGPAGIFVVGDHAKMMEAAKTNPYLAKLMPIITVSDGKKQTHEGSVEPKNNAELYEDWKQALKMEGEKNDGKNGSGVLFNIVIVGDKKTGATQQKTGLEAIGGTNIAAPQNSVLHGRLRKKARKEARLRKTSQATASSAYSKPTENEDGSRPSDSAGVENQSSEARPEKSSVPHPVGARPESMSTTGLESMLEQLVKGVPVMTLTDRDYMDTNSAATTTAENLKEAVEADVFPSDPLTREHFGFSRASTMEEETSLLGLYQGLLIHLPSPPSTKTLQGWQEGNTIAEGVIHAYDSQCGCSTYFDWFKKHQHLVRAT